MRSFKNNKNIRKKEGGSIMSCIQQAQQNNESTDQDTINSICNETSDILKWYIKISCG